MASTASWTGLELLLSVAVVPSDAAPNRMWLRSHSRVSSGSSVPETALRFTLTPRRPPFTSADGEIHSAQQGTGVDPRIGGVLVSGRGLAEIRRHAELPERSYERLRVVRPGAGGAHRAHHEFQGRLDLRLVGLGRQELRRGDDGSHHLAEVAVGVSERGRGARDHRGWRIVSDEPASQLRGDELGRGRVPGQHVQHLLAIALAASRFDRLPKDLFFGGIVKPWLKPEAATQLGGDRASSP